jgi:hypothetical protein
MVEGLLSKYKILISYPCAEKKKEGWKGGRKERREGGREGGRPGADGSHL